MAEFKETKINNNTYGVRIPNDYRAIELLDILNAKSNEGKRLQNIANNLNRAGVDTQALTVEDIINLRNQGVIPSNERGYAPMDYNLVRNTNPEYFGPNRITPEEYIAILNKYYNLQHPNNY